MGQRQPILDKIKRNLDVLGIDSTRNASSITVDSLTIRYDDSDLAKPMGGIDPSVSPYLGIGVANPGKLVLKGAAGQNTIAAIMTSALRLRVLGVLGNFANNKIVEAGDTSTVLAEIEGHEDLLGMGQ